MVYDRQQLPGINKNEELRSRLIDMIGPAAATIPYYVCTQFYLIMAADLEVYRCRLNLKRFRWRTHEISETRSVGMSRVFRTLARGLNMFLLDAP